MNVTLEPDTAEVKLEVISVLPKKSFVVVATELGLSATTIAPAVPADTVGAAGATLSKLYVSAVEDGKRLPAASAALAVTA